MFCTANLYKRFLCICLLYGSFAFLVGGCVGSYPSTQPQSREVMAPAFQEAQQLYDYGQFQRAIELWERVTPSDPRYMDAQLGIRSARLQIEQIKKQQSAASQKIFTN